MSKKCVVRMMVFALASILIEVVLFNRQALFSMAATNQELEVERQGDIFSAVGMEGSAKYVYIGAENSTEDGAPYLVSFTVALQDEGNSAYYDLAQQTLYPPVEKSKYLRIHSYGDVKGIRITLKGGAAATAGITKVIYDARVPWFLSVPRMLGVMALFVLGWMLRPSSRLYTWEWKSAQKKIAVAVLLLLNIGLLFVLVRSNPAFLKPVWPYHQQYQQLAAALAQGRVDIDAGDEAIKQGLEAMDNPYDMALRVQMVENVGNVWDTCYYNGKFYVYFGIVPVLLFYLPYYLIFHGAFPTWLGVFLAGSGVLAGVFCLLAQVRRRWFPDSPFAWYLILSVIMGNHLNLFCAMLHADFYYLPIICALCLSLWGISLMISAAENWQKERGYVVLRLTAGAFCLALTAGCRPQFLVGSFLVIPILLPCFLDGKKAKQGDRKQLLQRIAAIVLPYVSVASALMYYNYIRFGSVVDFGANYNLTTNDMTRRGMELGRLPDGFFMYLFQPFSFQLSFPFAEITPFYSDYLGPTIRDWTFGGVFWTHAILLSLLGIFAVKKKLKQKGIFWMILISIGGALLIVAADTEMAGIMNRYYADFLWLLMFAAVLVLYQMLEVCQGTKAYAWVLAFILAAGAWGVFYEMAVPLRGSGIMEDNIHRYYMLKAFFQ